MADTLDYLSKTLVSTIGRNLCVLLTSNRCATSTTCRPNLWKLLPLLILLLPYSNSLLELTNAVVHNTRIVVNHTIVGC